MLNSWSPTLSPFDELVAGLNDLKRFVERTLDDSSGALSTAPGGSTSFFAGSWPRLSCVDEGARFVLRAEVPGMARDDIKLSLTEDTLTLRGERRVMPPEGYQTLRQERVPLSFTRSVRLPCRVDLEAVSASVRDGILTVCMEKAEQAKPRQISVSAS